METNSNLSTNLNPSVEEIFDKVASIVSKILVIDENEIKMDSMLAKDLGADALDVVELTMNLEKEFGLVLPDEIFMPQEIRSEDTDEEETLNEEDFDAEEDLVDDEDIAEEYEDNDDFDVSFTLTIADYVTYIYKALNGISD